MKTKKPITVVLVAVDPSATLGDVADALHELRETADITGPLPSIDRLLAPLAKAKPRAVVRGKRRAKGGA